MNPSSADQHFESPRISLKFSLPCLHLAVFLLTECIALINTYTHSDYVAFVLCLVGAGQFDLEAGTVTGIPSLAVHRVSPSHSPATQCVQCASDFQPCLSDCHRRLTTDAQDVQLGKPFTTT